MLLFLRKTLNQLLKFYLNSRIKDIYFLYLIGSLAYLIMSVDKQLHHKRDRSEIVSKTKTGTAIHTSPEAASPRIQTSPREVPSPEDLKVSMYHGAEEQCQTTKNVLNGSLEDRGCNGDMPKVNELAVKDISMGKVIVDITAAKPEGEEEKKESVMTMTEVSVGTKEFIQRRKRGRPPKAGTSKRCKMAYEDLGKIRRNFFVGKLCNVAGITINKRVGKN